MKVDWLFKNVTVIDGSGGPQRRRPGPDVGLLSGWGFDDQLGW